MATEEPPAKRRKVSDSLENHRLQYVTLTQHKIPVERVVTSKNPFPPLIEPLACRIVDIDDLGEYLIKLKCGAGKPTVEVKTTNRASPAIRQVLEDARALPAISSRPNNQFLQACHSAVVFVERDMVVLEIELLWCNTTSLWDKVDDVALDVLRRYLPVDRAVDPSLEDWQPRDFYDNVHVPSKDSDPSNFRIPGLETSLYPFQRRTLQWILYREGVTLASSGAVQPNDRYDMTNLPLGFSQATANGGHIYYVNHALGVVSSSFNEVIKAFAPKRGGLLADEMGLGKTLAVIGAVCSHPRFDPSTEIETLHPSKSGATLIITPATLLEQWRDEIAEHAPGLKVLHYEGLGTLKRKTKSFDKLVDSLAKSDIVLTTYNVISREVHYVKEKPDRTLRGTRKFETPKSPLTEISWWRVCLDEAQMVESGVSNAATVARLIPREIAWAVTGTPLRQAHKDLYGVMVFLRYQPWCYSVRLWDRLVSYHRPLFRSMIKSIAIRHTKDFVREDLKLPPQSRHTITLPFTAVEEQHYENLFDEMCNEVNLRADGSPRGDDWDPEDPKIVEQMRRWLTRLRQTCLHPEVGHRNRKALGRGVGPLRTVGQVVDVMIDQAEGSLRTEQRALFMSQIRRGQMLENAKRPKEALALWNKAHREVSSIVEECQTRLDDEIKHQDQEKAVIKHEAGDNDSSTEEEELDSTIQTYRQRLRSALEVQHICIFFAANAYFQLKSDEDAVKPESEEFHALEKQETDAYDAAKKIRGQLLAEVLKKANGFIKSVHDRTSSTLPESLQKLKPHEQYSGIESRRLFEKFYQFCEAINEQGEYFQTMRTKMIDFLKQGLIDDDAGVELQGDEYENSTKHQDEMYVYMESLRILFADRSYAITGLENQLIRHEVRSFARQAQEGGGPAPELMLKLLAERQKYYIDPNKLGSLRGIVTEARHLVNNLQTQEASGSTRARAELDVAESLHDYIQKVASSRSKALAQLEQEVNLFRDTMNSRLDYYRALQKISDTVAPYEEERVGQPLDENVFYDTLRGEEAVIEKVSTLMSKRRYLMHLKDESTNSAPRICTICQGEFEIGTLTVCGHQFCKECIQLWWNEHRNCPVCKRRLHLHDFHDITYKPVEIAVQAETPGSTVVGSPVLSNDNTPIRSIYSDISTKTLNEIKNIDLHGASFGSKVDMLLRHIFWLRDHDFGTKSIIFSQYRDFLDVLSRAFKQHNISHTAFDEKSGIQKFKTDPAVECFLLHAKAHSAGLNLVCASHVFLCEPLLATAVELQAIARVHRIGQHRATTVWMYVIGGTVEETIYDLSVTRRLEHIKRNVKNVGKSKAGSLNDSGTVTPKLLGETVIDAANSLELQEADMKKLLTTGKSGGEHVDKGDLWQCLFGKSRMRERVMGNATAGDKAADEEPAGGEIGRFLRAEAASSRAAEATGHFM